MMIDLAGHDLNLTDYGTQETKSPKKQNKPSPVHQDLVS